MSVNPPQFEHRQHSSDDNTHKVAALNIAQLSFAYAKKLALSDVSFTITAGETVILLGPNGAGKTTLFSLICGLYAADQGDVTISGLPLLKQSDALKPLGIVFQSQTLDLDLSVVQNLRYFCALHGLARKTANQRIEAGLSRLDLASRKHDKVRTLNGGHRRRVEIIRATLHAPRILLLDEPTVGLDIPTRSELVDYIHKLPQEHDCAVLWATHLIDEIQPDDRVIMLHQGCIHHDDAASKLLEKTQSRDFGELMQKVMTA